MTGHTSRQAQLAAAGRLFRQKGYLAATAREVAKASKVRAIDGIGKEDLLSAIARRAADEFFAAVEPIADNDEPAQLKLRHAIIAHVGVITRNLDASAVYFNEWRHLSPRRRALFAKRRDEYEALFRAILREGIQSGIFAPVDEKFAGLLVLSALNWTHQWYKPDGPLTAEEVGRTLADFLMNGLYRTA